jgi:Zn-dependent protease with chaperone function
MNLREGGWSNLFASHPPMAARIAALKEMAFQGPPR